MRVAKRPPISSPSSVSGAWSAGLAVLATRLRDAGHGFASSAGSIRNGHVAREMMLTSRLSRVSTGRRRTWMSDMLRAAASVSSSPKAILHVLAHHFPDWHVRAIKSGCVRKFSR